MQLGMTIRSRDARWLKEHIPRFEALGIDIFWIPELYGFDAVSLMGFIAAITRRAKIGSGIVPLYTRTPSLIAMTAAGVDAISNGRCMLGLGASGAQVIEGFHGVTYDAPVSRTEEIIDICHRVWLREKVSYQGRFYKIPMSEGKRTGLGKALKIIESPIRQHIPIFVAALGGANVKMAARVADGWISFLFWPERASAVWGKSLSEGKEERDQSLDPLEIVAPVMVGVGGDVSKMRETAAAQLALYIGGMGAVGANYYNDLVAKYGMRDEAFNIQRLYLSGEKKAAAALVPPSLVEGVTIIGDETTVRDRVSAYREAGVTILNVSPIGPEPERTIELVNKAIDE